MTEPQPVYTEGESYRADDAREFEGYNVKPQVYGTYPHQDDYPPDSKPPPTDYRGRGDYPHEGYDREYSYSESRQPPPEDYYPPSRDRYEEHDYPSRSEAPYRDRGDWMESRDYPHRHGGYRDEDYPPGDRYLPSDGPPPTRERYPPADIPPLREGRAPARFPPMSNTPPIRERRYPGEEYRRPPPVRDEYGYGGHVPPSRSGKSRYCRWLHLILLVNMRCIFT